jgi:hypothetical protein
MTPATATLIVSLCGLYASIGAVFALLVVGRWLGRLDPAAAHATWGFRALVFPGIAFFWPLFLLRVLQGAMAPPDEWTAHRAAVRRGRVRVEVLR